MARTTVRKIFVSGLSLIYPEKSYKGNVGIKLFSPLLAKTNSKIYCLLNFPHKWRNKNNQKGAALSLLAVFNNYSRPKFNIARYLIYKFYIPANKI